jgi:hypothetical protein
MTLLNSNKVIKTTNYINNDKKDNLFQSLINIVAIIIFAIIVFLIYKYLIEDNYTKLRLEGFTEKINNTITNVINNKASNNTIYENSLQTLYGNNIRLMCGILPTIGNKTNVCSVGNEPFVIYQFPIHIIKLIDGKILAVFNDGRLYLKDSMTSTIWSGPITNSLPNDIIPLRMITLSTDLVTLLGVGYDNILYIKAPDNSGNLNITTPWVQVPNNSNIIYILFDMATNYMISIDINGKLFTKNSFDITTINQELVSNINRPILRLYYDLNGYMLLIDNKFDLYQFTDINWKTSAINVSRGANSSKIQDLLYDNDGKMYGLVFNPDSFIIQIMKQTEIFYLSDFFPIDLQLKSNTSTPPDFVMSDQDIIKCKIGSIYEYLSMTDADDPNDDDPNFAYQKQIIESQAKLRNFCATRSVTYGSNNYDNYDLLASVDNNNDKIKQLKEIINNLISYEPTGSAIKEKYPIIA